MAASWKNAGMTVAPPSAIAKGSIATIGLEDHWSPYYGHAIQEYPYFSPSLLFLSSHIFEFPRIK